MHTHRTASRSPPAGSTLFVPSRYNTHLRKNEDGRSVEKMHQNDTVNANERCLELFSNSFRNGNTGCRLAACNHVQRGGGTP